MGTGQQEQRKQGAKKQEMAQKAGRECHVTRDRVDVGSDSAQRREATAGLGAEPPADLTRLVVRPHLEGKQRTPLSS